MNIILNDVQREVYKSTIEELFVLCPDTITRKIARANIQQAFVLDEVRKLSDKKDQLLCVGSFEDTACEALVKLGYNVHSIDPCLNMSLNDFFKITLNKFDLIFSTSVIEHVEDDELFIDQICRLLNHNGYAVLTCDFNNDYRQGMGKPSEDFRLYTKDDLLIRLNSILEKNGCELYGEIDYDHAPDFQYGVYTYTFATFVFKKI